MGTAAGSGGGGGGGRDTGGGGAGGGGEGDAGFAEMADFMLRQLLSKEVLLQPMMEIGAKYPAWLDAHRCAANLTTLALQPEPRQHPKTSAATYLSM